MLRRIRWYLWVLIGILVIYTGISIYFMEHFFAGTTINGEQADYLTTAQAESLVLRQAEEYGLVLEQRDGRTTVLDGEKLAVSFSQTDEVRQAKRVQNGFLWPRMFWQSDSLRIIPAASFSDVVLAKNIRLLDCVKTGEAPQDAWVELTDDGYEIHAEKQGDKLNTVRLKEAVRKAAGRMQETLNLEEAGCYEEPAVTVDLEEMIRLSEKLERWFGAQVTYEFGPETEVVDAAAISSFITLEGYEAELNQEAVADWIGELADKRDTYKKSRSFQSTLRGIITVKGGNYGWQIDQETESAALLKLVEEGQVTEKEPAYLQTGNAWSSNSDIGDTYIEVDMGAQHMWFYKNGSLVIDTDVVTGNISRNYGTPAIVAAIQYKQRNAVLRGADYATPVKYWMPFYGNYGIHDSSWRSTYGGDIYLTSGSHGCVNTPPAAAKVIFENVEKGTPVVLYY
jgi:hypothetical protein